MAQKKYDALLLLLLAVSVAANVLLGWKSRRYAVDSKGTLPIGAFVPPLIAKNLQGTPETVVFGGAPLPTVVYVLSPTCHWCDRNMENAMYLAHSSQGNYRFVGISLGEQGLEAYYRRHRLNFPVYYGLSPSYARLLRLGSTPQTIVVSTDGEVLRNWTGAYTSDVRPEIENYFQVRLPGLQPPEDIR